ncbi:MAG UNVERIFIED_CONTAM: hypothetical protein LVR29_06200 [Microcystis novacekii LVE1205-3]
MTIELQVANLDKQQEEGLVNALSNYFKGKAIGRHYYQREITAAIATVSGIIEDTLKLVPQPWCQKTEAQLEQADRQFCRTAGFGRGLCLQQEAKFARKDYDYFTGGFIGEGKTESEQPSQR